MKLKLIEWNLNFGSDKNAKTACFVKQNLNEADILVFTEVVYTETNYNFWTLLEKSYKLYVSKPARNINYNQIVIAINKNLMDMKCESIPLEPKIKTPNDFPNMLHLCITYNGQKYNLIGARIKIGGKSLDVDYKLRNTQFKNLVKYMESLDKVILVGDFNNGWIKADSNLSYEEAKEHYEYIEKDDKKIKNPLRFFNFHLMKKELGNSYLLSEIGKRGSQGSWGLGIYNGIIKYGKIKNDQVITKGITVVTKQYSWAFIKANENEYIRMIEANMYKKGNKIKHGYPDHAQLIIEFEMD